MITIGAYPLACGICAAVFTLSATICAAARDTKLPLRDVTQIENPLFAIAVAKEVADVCDTLAARTIKGLSQLYALRTKANQLGYSDTEIRAYIGSDSEKARMRKKGETLLRQNGVDLQSPDSFCAYGRAEIQKNSAIGVLLRVK